MRARPISAERRPCHAIATYLHTHIYVNIYIIIHVHVCVYMLICMNINKYLHHTCVYICRHSLFLWSNAPGMRFPHLGDARSVREVLCWEDYWWVDKKNIYVYVYILDNILIHIYMWVYIYTCAHVLRRLLVSWNLHVYNVDTRANAPMHLRTHTHKYDKCCAEWEARDDICIYM